MSSANLTPEQIVKMAVAQIDVTPPTVGFVPAPYQVPPDYNDPSWDTWLLMGGRGAGKTRTGVEYVMQHLREFGRYARVGVMAPTIKAAREVCAEGESGLVTLYGGSSEIVSYNKTLGEVRHKNGGLVKFMGSEKVESWRGPQWSLLWIDEYVVCDPEAIDLALLALRLGEHPRLVVTTTPQPIPNLKALVKDPKTVVSKATSFDNPHISQVALRRMKAQYEGTRLGRQELYAELLEDVDGAFWSSSLLDRNRKSIQDVSFEDMERIVIAIDPSTSDSKRADDTGICVAGKKGHHYYIFDIMGIHVKPIIWAEHALRLFKDYQADCVVAERNNGSDMVESTIRTVFDNKQRSGEWKGVPVKIKTVWASRGKQTRAEPIAALDEQGYIHHVGFFPAAEEQMTTYPVVVDKDDMVDARVWAISELSGNATYDDLLPISFTRQSTWSI